MTSQPGKQTTAIHIFWAYIAQHLKKYQGHQVMKLVQLIEYIHHQKHFS